MTIQLWIATSTRGLRQLTRLARNDRERIAPQAVLVFTFGFLIFAVAPYFLLVKRFRSNVRGWKFPCSRRALLSARCSCWSGRS